MKNKWVKKSAKIRSIHVIRVPLTIYHGPLISKIKPIFANKNENSEVIIIRGISNAVFRSIPKEMRDVCSAFSVFIKYTITN